MNSESIVATLLLPDVVFCLAVSRHCLCHRQCSIRVLLAVVQINLVSCSGRCLLDVKDKR